MRHFITALTSNDRLVGRLDVDPEYGRSAHSDGGFRAGGTKRSTVSIFLTMSTVNTRANLLPMIRGGFLNSRGGRFIEQPN